MKLKLVSVIKIKPETVVLPLSTAEKLSKKQRMVIKATATAIDFMILMTTRLLVFLANFNGIRISVDGRSAE